MAEEADGVRAEGSAVAVVVSWEIAEGALGPLAFAFRMPDDRSNNGG